MENNLYKIIRTKAQYARVMSRIAELMSNDNSTDESSSDELDILSLLAEKYEHEHFPISLPDPIDAILFRMEQQGLRQVDVVSIFGGKSRTSEVLNRKRPLTIPMIRKLHEQLDIPLEVLVQISQGVVYQPDTECSTSDSTKVSEKNMSDEGY